jgi:hypothetical protein
LTEPVSVTVAPAFTVVLEAVNVVAVGDRAGCELPDPPEQAERRTVIIRKSAPEKYLLSFFV